MSGISVSKAKRDRLSGRMAALGVSEGEIDERFILGSGPGGQKVNKTSSCVHLMHRPSGIEIKCRRSRSRELNRYWARCELCERLVERIEGEKSRRQQERERVRRQKRRRSRRQKQRMLEGKHEQSEKKQRRRAVNVHAETS